MKRGGRIVGTVVLVLVVTGIVCWLELKPPCEGDYPYEEKYFTAEMKAKYSTAESVLDSMREGWRHDTEAHAQLMNEAYGFDIAKKFGRGYPSSSAMGDVRSVSCQNFKRMAFVKTSDSGLCFVIRRGRWVFYPETPRVNSPFFR
ncbi:MAG: hypothetical protein PHR35_00325 [Kiritimatiellae bacterium]|nr:hypothetical protein [Kiritimatiellia bacterium]